MHMVPNSFGLKHNVLKDLSCIIYSYYEEYLHSTYYNTYRDDIDIYIYILFIVIWLMAQMP